MKILAVECSTDRASLALLADGAVAASVGLEVQGRRSQGLFDAADALVTGAGWSWEAVDAYAVGRGPGAYTGLRVCLTAANGWALPGQKPVWTVSSAAALAAEVLAERPEAGEVVVWGDARRGMIWAGRFGRATRGGVSREGGWELRPVEARGSFWTEAHWVEPARVPRAEWVGHLFYSGGASEEPEPIYLNPAVAVAPRFDAEGQPLTS